MSSYLDAADNASGADPSGFLSAGVAAVKLVGAVAKVAPHVKHAVDQFQQKGAPGAPQTLNRSVTVDGTSAPASLHADPEREARAYETVNYVLRTLGKRIGEAGLVSGPALTNALSAASTHIEVELFSVNANRLFQSLAKKLADAVLVNSVFTSIYFIGAITAELGSSLPNYKPTYPPLGPYIIQQIFRAAIGEDAFRENLTANLDAYKTLATTAGLLRPTDIGYSIFPNFPSLTPTRYSSKSFTDVRNHKSIFNKLIQHFDMHGFPQPLPGNDVGPIKDWRFLSGDSNTRFYDVEKADKHIGEAMGRVLYWLITSAERMPPGMAVIAYYKQHIQLVSWMGAKFGFRVLSARDLDLKGPHLRLDNKCRATVEAWLIILPSQSAHLHKQQSIAQWSQAQQNQQQLNQMLQQPPASPISAQTSSPSMAQHRMSVASSISSVDAAGAPQPNLTLNTDSNGALPRVVGMSSMMAHAGQVSKRTNSYPRPATVTSPGPHSAVSSPGPGIGASPVSQPVASTPATPAMAELSTSASSPAAKMSTIFTPPMSTASSPPFATTSSYFPALSGQSIAPNPCEPIVNKRASVVRRKAPPPPRKFILAKALYDFEPEDDGGEELVFHEGDEIEIVEKSEELESDGWCKAKVKGSTKIGLAPLDYLKEVEVKSQPPKPVSKPPREAAGMSEISSNRSVSMPMVTGPAAASFGLPPSGATASNVSAPSPQNVVVLRGHRSSSGAGVPDNAFQPHLGNIHESTGVSQTTPMPAGHVMSQGRHAPQQSTAIKGSTASPPTNLHRMPSGQHSQGIGVAGHLQNTQQNPNSAHLTSSGRSGLAYQGIQSQRMNRKPSGTHQTPLTQSNLAAQQLSSRPAGQAGVDPQPRSNAQKPDNISFAPSFSLNLSPQHQGSSQHQSSSNQHGSHQPNNSSTHDTWDGANNNFNGTSNGGYGNYTNNAIDPNAGIYPAGGPQINNYSNAQSPAYYSSSGTVVNPMYSTANYQNPNFVNDPNAMNAGPTYINAPTYYSGDNGGFTDGLVGSEVGAATDSVLGSFVDGQDPASIDPFYVTNHPGFASTGPASPASFQSASGNPIAAETAAAVGLGGADTISPLAGLALGQSTTSLDMGSVDATASSTIESGIMTSPLAGLAITNTSSTSLQVSTDQASGEQSVSVEQQTTSFVEEDTTSNGGQSSAYMEQDITTQIDTTYSEMGDNSDDEMGYA
ncbi:hypothetical protein MMC13_006725 [Lambiella insularis]|nr:hypothetical protein [Lambiella insularis]